MITREMPYTRAVLCILLFFSFTCVVAAGPIQRLHDAQHRAAIAMRVQDHLSHDSLTTLKEVRNRFSNPIGSINKRTGWTQPGLRLKLQAHYQHAVILPTVLGASIIRAFWLQVAMDAIYSQTGPEPPKTLITFTKGQFQATFSCLGQAVPWVTIHDIAMGAANAVRDGWIDTFDAVFEQETTGVTVWASVRVLGQR